MQSAVLDWYAANARPLAFRRTTDPWAVLLSEVIAQQTQAARAAEAWERLIAQFPTPATMAAVPSATVIRAWRGLGYNRRAVALHRTAVAIVDGHGGRVPNDLEALTALPGIGPYTARAVLAIAFDRPVAALDTNIRRVIERAFMGGQRTNGSNQSNGPRGQGGPMSGHDFQDAADGFVPADRAAAWTHALMDVGAAFCRKRDPRCDACPLRTHCRFDRTASVTTAPRTPGPAFESTTRWLRGRIMDRLRDAPDDAWVRFDAGVGGHSRDAVNGQLARLAVDGLLEWREDGAEARLVVGPRHAPRRGGR